MSISLRSRGEEAFFGGDVMHLPIQISAGLVERHNGQFSWRWL
jgi:hypothetical protein